MAPKLSPSKALSSAKSPTKKNLMPPPPLPEHPVSLAILEPEANALADCLKNAAVKTGQIYRFHADTRRLGISSHAPKPPRSLTSSLGREIEKYDQIVDAMESHLLRAVAALERDLRREEQRIKLAENAAIASRTRSKSASVSPTSTRIPLPPLTGTDDSSQPLPSAPLPTPTSSPPGISSANLARRPSAISISSLQRPNLPLKLDLSSPALRISTDEGSLFSSGLASPVTLAPKSARIAGPSEFPPDLMAAFSSSSQTIDLTMEPDGGDAKVLDSVRGTANRPIELDMDDMDIDMAMTDLFGDPTDTGSNDASTMEGLFSPVVLEQSANADADKPMKTEDSFLQNINASNNADIFSTLTDPDNTNDPQQIKDSQAVPLSAPSPESLLASFANTAPLPVMGQMSQNNMSVTDTPFDMSGLDLSNLDQSFFGGGTEADMNFPMDMDQFMATVSAEGTADGTLKKVEES
ncbi:hypothetical protein H0H93_013072 [Arthromyces matolae]|nr:hypothetical protein H0H93_013072 [Arthromyces matolae]